MTQIERGARDECWLWPFFVEDGRYGKVHYDGRQRWAHRVAVVLDGRRIESGMVVRHRCPGGPNTRCVNPDHLEIGTQADNMQDARLDGTVCVGERNPQARLTTEAVQQIRCSAAEGERIAVIATRFGVSPSTARRVARGESWTHLPMGGPS